MHKTIFFTIVAVLFISFLTVSSLAKDQGKFMIITGFDTLANVIDPGTIICVHGEFTGDLSSPCTEGTTRVHIKGQIVEMISYSVLPDSSGPFFDGLNRLTVDCNLDASLNGKCWGKFEWPVSAGGIWEGVIHTEQSFSSWEWKIDLVGTGNGGALEGMQLEYSSSAPPWEFVGEFMAQTHDPKADKQ
jgi:hypothetical protein